MGVILGLLRLPHAKTPRPHLWACGTPRLEARDSSSIGPSHSSLRHYRVLNFATVLGWLSLPRGVEAVVVEAPSMVTVVVVVL